ncbi:MAG: hypothetical protein LC097_13120 [Burkholderiales bacterium]|nr:hypothetical protein [Burkholderiales bacterium]
MTKPLFLGAMLLSLLAGAASVHAHDDAYLDTMQAPNGGQLRMAGVYHFELVVDKSRPEAADKPVVVHLTDHAGQKVSSAGATGTVTLLAGKAKTVVTLQPDGDNRLKGSGRYASTPDLKAVVSITTKGQAAETARFTPLARAQDEPMEHGKH